MVLQYLISSYEIGAIAFLIILILAVIFAIMVAIGFNKQTDDLWATRRLKLRENSYKFETELNNLGFEKGVSLTIQADYRSTSKIDIFRMYVDDKNNKIAFSSFEEDAYKAYVLNFKDIKSFNIIDGVNNTTSTSFSTGSAVGSNGLYGGMSSTDTYQKTSIEKMKLKIDLNGEFSYPIIVFLFKYLVDVSSDTYNDLINNVERIKSILSKIIELNKNEQ